MSELSWSLHLSISKLVKRRWIIESEKMERIQESKEKGYQKGIDNFALVVGLYNQDLCVPDTNFFIINLLSRRIEGAKA